MLDTRFELRFSKQFLAVLVLLHTLALCAVSSFSILIVEVRWVVAILVLLNLAHRLRHDVFLRAKDSWVSLTLKQNAIWIATRSGELWSGKILPHSVCSSWVIVLAIKRDVKLLPQYQVLFCDALASDAFRELAVRLRFMPQLPSTKNAPSTADF